MPLPSRPIPAPQFPLSTVVRHRGITVVPFLFSLGLLVGAGVAHAQSPAMETVFLPPLAVPSVPAASAGIELDGRVDEPAWSAAPLLPSVMHLPDFGIDPTERTEFRIIHDGKHLYVSCKAFDSDPSGIRAPSLLRDERRFLNDSCSIYLDSANDGENAIGFVTTPSGLRADLSVSNDGEGAVNADWNTYWDVAVSQDDQGWYAEMRIPFSSLIFQDEAGQVTMGFSLLRNIARKNERTIHPPIPPRWGMSSFRKPSQMRKMTLEGVTSSRPLYLSPYLLGGGGYTHDLDAGGTTYARRTDRTREVGVDVKYALTSNLNLDLTANTDFAQVEADDQQVNLTRFSLFFPEKRRFFQERGAIFEVPLGESDRLFHSRQIGLVGGEPVRIYGGARLVGRVGEWDVGILDMQAAQPEGGPSQNQGVVRLRRRVLNANSYLGGIVTSRHAEGRSNVVYGLDGIFRLFGQDYLTVNWAQSFDEVADSASSAPSERALVRSRWERRGQDGLTYGIGLLRSGRVFEPGMGYLRRRDYSMAEGSLGYGWRPARGSGGILSFQLGFDGTLVRRNGDGTVESAEGVTQAVLETTAQHLWTVSLPWRYEHLDRAFFPGGGSAEVPAGDYGFTSVVLDYRPPQGPPFRPTLTLEAGQFYDGHRISFSFSPSWSASRHLSLSGSYGVDRVSFPARDTDFTAHIARLRTEVMISTALSVVSFVQYNSTRDALLANFRIRYNPREGNDLYLVWNEGVFTDTSGFDPGRPWADRRTLLIKYTHTLPFGA